MSSQTSSFVVLGKIVGAYGIKGWVRIHPFADDPAAWAKLASWRLGSEAEPYAQWQEVTPQETRLHGDSLQVRLAEIANREAAEALRGSLLGVPRAELPPTAENEYYWGDLSGLAVVNLHGQSLGTVKEVMATGGNPVLRVSVDDAKAGNKERLLPFVSAVVTEVNLSEGVIRVDWDLDW